MSGSKTEEDHRLTQEQRNRTDLIEQLRDLSAATEKQTKYGETLELGLEGERREPEETRKDLSAKVADQQRVIGEFQRQLVKRMSGSQGRLPESST